MEEQMEPNDPQKMQPGGGNYLLVGLVALVVIVGIIWYAGVRNKSNVASTSAPATSQQNQPAQSAEKAAVAAVEYADSGFSPQSVTIKAGETVAFVNKSSSDMFVASAPHPLHNGYDGTTMSEHCAPGATPSFDSCKAVPSGGSYTFTFDKTGKWPFHNHLDPTKFGSVTVQ